MYPLVHLYYVPAGEPELVRLIMYLLVSLIMYLLVRLIMYLLVRLYRLGVSVTGCRADVMAPDTASVSSDTRRPGNSRNLETSDDRVSVNNYVTSDVAA